MQVEPALFSEIQLIYLRHNHPNDVNPTSRYNVGKVVPERVHKRLYWIHTSTDPLVLALEREPNGRMLATAFRFLQIGLGNP